MTTILPLKEAGKNDVSTVGGKGAQLGELTKAGFPVPEGFIVTTSASGAIIGKLENAIKKILSTIDSENTAQLEKASNKIRALIINEEFAEDIGKSIVKAYKKIGGMVAVRSSATAEDQKEASFAGQMATFLNVKEEGIIEAVKKCIASAFTARAIYYRKQRKIPDIGVSIAVVIQRMVKAKKAGVAFSINPVSNNEEEIIVEAASGLGEAVVGGKVTPDTYIVNRNGFKTKESQIRQSMPVLKEQEMKEIAENVDRISKHYKFPQDVEWAIDDKGKLQILQARPVTTLQIRKKPVWKKILAREYGVQYTELSIKCLSPLNKAIVPYTFYEQTYVPEDGNEACYIDEEKWNTFCHALKRKWVDEPANYVEFERMFMKYGSGYMEAAKKIAKENLKDKTNAELKSLYSDYLKRNLAYGPFIWMQFIINNIFAEKAKDILTEKLGKGNKKVQDYLEVALKPEKKAASIQLNEIAAKWESLSEDEKGKTYENFKWVPCLDVHNRPWTKEEFFSHISEFRKSEKKNDATYESVMNEIKPSEKEKQILQAARGLAYLKDLKDDFRRQGIMHAQKLFEEIAGRMKLSLEKVSYLTEEEITEFLSSGKTISRERASERKKGFAIYFNEDNAIECKNGKETEAALNWLGIITQEEYSDEIWGMPASTGKEKGVVAIVKGVSDLAKVRKGNIMVAVTTHPDYVPAMQRASAIVTDEGGITSHAAIVARELGLPCIVGTKHATKLLKDGDKIEVDAFTGSVRKLKP